MERKSKNSRIGDYIENNILYAVRGDGYLYCHDDKNASKFESSLGGPAYDLVRRKDTVAAATVNGVFMTVELGGKRKVTRLLPAPALSTLAAKDAIYCAGADGKVRKIDGDTGKVTTGKW